MAETYQYIVNQSRDFITLINRDYRYEIVNDSYCKAVERPREEILGRTVSEVWGEERFEEAIRPRLETCFAGEEVHFVDEFRFGSVRKNSTSPSIPTTSMRSSRKAAGRLLGRA